ncbi:hypothetical protein GXP67_28730 [Rhodocytophaga rosea]|uniref:Uncharacterized protein n=1 Tax=Rhodocytophaga rosea TaxID=2704465 RepID=A0A6C0GQZ8_9BACT|nr:hypothetical protein [Rhodocytophaga rosea]QHT70357.1 hypothetical protein GXP67_28730 [Rhodocytophaga rosea]
MSKTETKKLLKKWEVYKLNRLIFLLSGFPSFLAGLDLLDQGNYLFGGLYLVAGCIFIIAAFLVQRLKSSHLDALQLTGVLVLFITSIDLYLQHKRYLPAVYILSALISLWAFWYGKKKAKEKAIIPTALPETNPAE